MSQSKANRSAKASSRQNASPEFTAALSQFMGVTGMAAKEATKFIQRYGRADVAIGAYYNDPDPLASPAPPQGRREVPAQSQGQKLNALFDKYRTTGPGEDPDTISIDGTLSFCADLEVDPEDVVLLAVAFELKAPGVGEFTRAGWKEGWRSLGVDSIAGMKNVLPRLRRNLDVRPGHQPFEAVRQIDHRLHPPAPRSRRPQLCRNAASLRFADNQSRNREFRQRQLKLGAV